MALLRKLKNILQKKKNKRKKQIQEMLIALWQKLKSTLQKKKQRKKEVL